MANSFFRKSNTKSLVWIIAALVVAYVFVTYVRQSGAGAGSVPVSADTMDKAGDSSYVPTSSSPSGNGGGVPEAANNFDDDGQYGDASGSGAEIAGGSCDSGNNPSNLLPKDENSEWSDISPLGKGSLKKVQLLSPGEQYGIVTSVNKHPNMQLRSQPPVPKGSEVTWGQSPNVDNNDDKYRPYFDFGGPDCHYPGAPAPMEPPVSGM